MTMRKNKSIIIGITGSVAAYKTPDLIKSVKNENIEVKVVYTESAAQFVTPLTLETVSGYPVFSGIFDSPMAHIKYTDKADALLIVPASANTVSKIASGIADNLLTTIALSFRGPTLLAPAMNWRMYENPIFKDKLDYIKSKGLVEIAPDSGKLACGEEGVGRMASLEEIKLALLKSITKQDLNGLKVLVTAGPTREYFDPIRFISNRSSGKMGFSLARAAYLRGAEVSVISGTSCLESYPEIEFLYIDTAEEMEKAVKERADGADILIMSAAVADYRPAEKLESKVDKSKGLNLELIKTNDIISSVASANRKTFIVGFSAETGDRIDRARMKMQRKKMDMIVFNDVSQEGAGFDTDTNVVTIIDKDNEYPLPKMTKPEVADAIFDKVIEAKNLPNKVQ